MWGKDQLVALYLVGLISTPARIFTRASLWRSTNHDRDFKLVPRVDSFPVTHSQATWRLRSVFWVVCGEHASLRSFKTTKAECGPWETGWVWRHISEASQYCILDRTPRIANWIVYNRTASVPLTVNATGRCIPPNNHPPIAGTCIKYDYAKKLKPRREHGRKCRMVCAKKIQ